MKQLGLYIHIPFCKQKCDYCDFLSFSNIEYKQEEYINSLLEEIKEKSSKISRQEYMVTTIYIGGGTPSNIEAKYIIKILNLIKECFNLFNPEITIEVNPGTVDEEKLKTYYQEGIKRLSIGLQSTNNELLKLIGRIHTYEDFLDTYNMARKIGFKNINVDLMIGLPNQTLADVNESLNRVIELNPEHISMYSLIVEENTKLENRLNNKEFLLPEDEIERRMYWNMKSKLEENGFIQYEISNFSKKGFESKHNLNCWEQEEYIGFGLGAHSYFEDTRFSNIKNFEEYIKTKGKYKIIEEKQTKEIKMKEYMMLGFRKIEGISISKFEQKFQINPLFYFRFEISSLEEQDLIEVDLDDIKLTKKGLDFANQVFKEFV